MRKIDIVAETATSFVDAYLAEHGYFTPDGETMAADDDDLGMLRVSFYRAMPDKYVADTIFYTFVYGRALEDDPAERERLVDQVMRALELAHPEINDFARVIEIDHWNY